LEAAKRLDCIAADLQNMERSQWYWRIQTLCAKDAPLYSEILLQLIWAIGFRSSSKTGAEFCEELCFLVGASGLDDDCVVVPLGKK
jgi:hypothetical protein